MSEIPKRTAEINEGHEEGRTGSVCTMHAELSTRGVIVFFTRARPSGLWPRNFLTTQLTIHSCTAMEPVYLCPDIAWIKTSLLLYRDAWLDTSRCNIELPS